MSNHSFTYRFVFKLLRLFCPNPLYEEIEGDLIYRFNKEVKAVGEKRAKRRLMWNVVRFFRPGILLRNRIHLNRIQMMLLMNHFNMAFRQIRKDKIFSGITIFGLSVSMAACLLIFHYSYFELTYDQHHKDAERIYRVATTLYEGDQVRYSSAQCSPKLTPVLKEQFTEVEESGRLLPTNWFDCMLSYPGHSERKIFNENKLYYADQGYLSLFHPTLLQGDASKALIKPFSAVLSVKTAQKYFGKENAIGKVLHLKGSGDENDYTVTGVMNDPALNSHIDAEILLSENSIKSDFGFQTAYTYLKTQPGISRHQVEEKFPPLVKTLIPPGSNIKAKLFLQQIADIHMNSTLQDEMKHSGNVRSVYFLILVAGAVLLIAWVNYINLTTARAVSRAKEVGIRKVTGATLTQIAFQFLTETMVFNFIGLAGAILLVIFLAPSFYAFIGLSLPPDVLLWKLNTNLIFVFSAFILCILLIGFFPARILSSFNPVKTIKGKLIPSASGISFRRVAVIFQFSCAIILIVSVMVFNRQFNFMQQQDIGVDIKRAIVLKAPVNIDSSYRNKLKTFRNELKSLAIIRSITTSTSVPGEGIGWTGEIKKEKDESSQDFAIHVIDQDFIDSYQLHLLAGRSLKENDFPASHFGDKLEPVLLNKRATEQLGYHQPEDAINERILWGSNTCLVVGVIDDFHQESLKKKFAPTLYTANNGPAMTIKLTEGADKNLAQSLTQLRGAWNIYFPNNPFDYYFLEDAYKKQYAGDEQLARLFHFFCLIAIILSCLGLFALSLFAVNQRMKEITIRKILGAPIVHLIHLLTKEYFILLTLAMIVALPVAMYGAHQWLNEFAYAATLNVWTFAMPVSLILLIAGFTVGGQTIRAAIQNPTKGLKHE